MAIKLLHLLRVMVILESCRGKMVRTEDASSGAAVSPPRARASGGDVPVLPPGTPGGASSSSASEEERRPGAARQSALHRRDMVSVNMFKVYEKYSKEPRSSSHKDGNTVRSFKAAPGTSEGREWFRFNLSSIQETEHILSASFHFLYKRPRHPHQHHPRPWPCRRAHSPSCGLDHPPPALPPPWRQPQLLLFSRGGATAASPSGAFGERLGNVTLPPPKRGSWQAVDVTALVRRARAAEEPLLAAEFDFGAAVRSQAQQKQAKAHAGPERPSSANLPYILVYADDRVIDEPNSVAVSLQRYGPFPGGEDERMRLANAPASATDPDPVPATRTRRDLLRGPLSPSDQIQTNDLPEVHFNSLKNHELWQSTYFPPKAKAAAAAAAKHGRKPGQESVNGEAQHPGLTQAGKPRVLSFDERTMKKARRRQWSEPRVCARRYLRVDFADIGWSEWVLAPKAFDAYYCAGTCGFPIPKVVRPSNHATIQSIVRAVGIVPGVPEPCCVPDKMSPLSVLFLDPDRNMVLKVYPGMSVDTCACR